MSQVFQPMGVQLFTCMHCKWPIQSTKTSVEAQVRILTTTEEKDLYTVT